MAAGKFTVLNVAMTKQLNGTIALGSTGFKLALCDATQALTAAWTGASGDGRYADITNEVTGTGYTAGGIPVEVVMSEAGGVVTIAADPVLWSGVTLTAKYGLIYKDGGNGDVWGYMDLETTEPAGRVVTASDLTILWPNGLLTAQRV